MANFVLVHGAWHGAWCWSRVCPALIRAGHNAHAVTLTGVGERAHLLSRNITLQTHINDVLGLIEAEELHDIVLVVHSYGGIVGTGVANQLAAGRVKHICYIDAVLPKPGEAWGSGHSAAVREQRISAAAATEHNAIPAPSPQAWGLMGADADWVRRRMTDHPAAPYTEPLHFDTTKLAAIGRTYLSCIAPSSPTIDPSRRRALDPQFWDGAWLPGSRNIDLATGHDAMVSAPQVLIPIMLECAA